MNQLAFDAQKAASFIVNNYPKKSLLVSLIGGGGIYYAVEKKKYYQIPLAILWPGAYAGYHMYKNRTYIHEHFKTHITVESSK